MRSAASCPKASGIGVAKPSCCPWAWRMSCAVRAAERAAEAAESAARSLGRHDSAGADGTITRPGARIDCEKFQFIHSFVRYTHRAHSAWSVSVWCRTHTGICRAGVLVGLEVWMVVRSVCVNRVPV